MAEIVLLKDYYGIRFWKIFVLKIIMGKVLYTENKIKTFTNGSK